MNMLVEYSYLMRLMYLPTLIYTLKTMNVFPFFVLVILLVAMLYAF